MRTVLDEVLQETFEAPGCHNGNCSCHSCAHKRQEYEAMQQEIKNMGLELNAEEEYELGKAFAKMKDLLKKGYRKVKPVIVVGDIIRRILTPVPDFREPPPLPPPVESPNQARFYEEERKRRRDALIQQAQRQKKNKGSQKPDPEITILQEILQEQEVTANPTLRYGAKGTSVVNLQRKLNYHNASIIPLKEDGIWGPKTQGSVLAFQKDKALVIDGIVGPKTWVKLNEPASPLNVLPPTQCYVRPQTEFEAPLPAQPAPAITRPPSRPCCMLGPKPSVLGSGFADPNNLGIHKASEVTAPLYTGQAGFLDLGHVRDLCDLTKFVYDQLLASTRYTNPVYTSHGKAELLKCPVDLLKTAMAISYEDSVGYEIYSYWGNSPGSHNSSFSPEDLCSNNLGTIIAEKAILSVIKNPARSFEAEVTAILNATLKVLDVQTESESQKAFNKINGRWVDYSGKSSFFAPGYLKRRNFSLVPWKVGHSSDKATPAWLTAGFSQYGGLFNYTHTAGKTIKRSDFWREIQNIQTDAASKYGANYDQP